MTKWMPRLSSQLITFPLSNYVFRLPVYGQTSSVQRASNYSGIKDEKSQREI